MKIEIMSPEQVAQSLAIPDLSDPSNGVHAINLMLGRIFDSFSRSKDYPLPAIYRFSPVTTVKENFDDLLFPADSPARSSAYTRYVSSETLLRTHTSSMIGRAVKQLGISPPSSLIFCPSLCFRRRNSAGRLHVGEPHQLDIWHIQDSSSGSDLEAVEKLVERSVSCAIPGMQYRMLEITKDIKVSHPYLARAFKVRALFKGEDVSILEAGVVKDSFLVELGLTTPPYSAVCAGIMLDRAVLLAKGIPDMRLLRSKDERVKKQMLSLAPYANVSRYPPIVRDISCVISQEAALNEIREKIHSCLGPDSELVEEIVIRAESAYSDLPAPVRERLSMKLGQKNVLLRLVLRSHDRTLLKTEANNLSNAVLRSLEI